MADAKRICSVPGCGKPHNRRGYCRNHGRRAAKYGDPLLTGKFKKICSIPGCGKFVKAHGYCNGHLKRWQKYGDPLAGATAKGAVPAWMATHSAYAGNDCLIWPFDAMSKGQGLIRLSSGHNMVASRYMCVLAHGEPPTPEHEAAHNCGKGHLGCVNPKHLRWATRAENLDDMIGHGTRLVGAKNPMAKLTEEHVRTIRKSFAPAKEIAAEYGIDPNHVSSIRARRSWKHVI